MVYPEWVLFDQMHCRSADPRCGEPRPQQRSTDAYGYISFLGNYYWVPGSQREDVKVLLYADRVKIYQHQTCLAEYPLPADGVKNAHFRPAGQAAPQHLPKHRKHGSQHEEQRLRALGADVAAYLDYALPTPGLQRHRFLRELFALSRQVTQTVFLQTLLRARRYRVVELQTLHRIAWFCMSQGEPRLPYTDVDESFRQRPAYQEGCLTDESAIGTTGPNGTPSEARCRSPVPSSPTGMGAKRAAGRSTW